MQGVWCQYFGNNNVNSFNRHLGGPPPPPERIPGRYENSDVSFNLDYHASYNSFQPEINRNENGLYAGEGNGGGGGGEDLVVEIPMVGLVGPVQNIGGNAIVDSVDSGNVYMQSSNGGRNGNALLRIDIGDILSNLF